jgi:lipoteichoic acid synthase
MNSSLSQLQWGRRAVAAVGRLYAFLAPRAYSVLIFVALACTLGVKFFHSVRTNLVGEYVGWILADISFLLGVELILALVCAKWPARWVIRLATVVAAVVCAWSLMNAGCLVRTGIQLLPRVMLPLVREPVSALRLIGTNIIKMPVPAVMLLTPSVIALAFFVLVMARPVAPCYKRGPFVRKVVICLVLVVVAAAVRPAVARRGSAAPSFVAMRRSSHVAAIMSFVSADYAWPPNPDRHIPYAERVPAHRPAGYLGHNVVIVVLEGVQYRETSLALGPTGPTPYLSRLAREGVDFSNTRSSLIHTTKALFAVLSGRFPSASQDLAEAVPVERPYLSMASVLRGHLGFRTAFFQSARGDFECRPGLVHNLGFEEFWARDDLHDPNSFLGYLGGDEFSMLQPITEWIQADSRPFLLTVLCSVTHDPYEVPQWYGEPPKGPLARYRQTIGYTDKFLEALDVELGRLNLLDKTIFCVVGDHGEGFGEHGLSGHALIAFDEVLRVPFCLRAPFLADSGQRVTAPVSSVDVTPTVLALLGFETEGWGLDGANVLAPVSAERKAYFSCWMHEGPAGYVKGNRKFIYDPPSKNLCVYDITSDEEEKVALRPSRSEMERLPGEIMAWRKGSIFTLDQVRSGKEVLFDRWQCRWTDRIAWAKYQRSAGE